MAFGAFLVAATLLALAPPEQARAQLLINVNPLQGDNSQTVWTFSGSSTASQAGNIQIGTGSITSQSAGTVLPYGRPQSPPNPDVSAALIRSNALPSGSQNWANYALASTANTPQITTSGGTRTISHVFLQNFSGNIDGDFVGIRVAGAAPLAYTNQSPVSWTGMGILPYSITNLTTSASGEYFYNYASGPYFAAAATQTTRENSGFRVMVSSTPVIPEPEEYALVFALFALGFVIIRRHFQKKQQRQQAATS